MLSEPAFHNIYCFELLRLRNRSYREIKTPVQYLFFFQRLYTKRLAMELALVDMEPTGKNLLDGDCSSFALYSDTYFSLISRATEEHFLSRLTFWEAWDKCLKSIFNIRLRLNFRIKKMFVQHLIKNYLRRNNSLAKLHRHSQRADFDAVVPR